MAKGPVCLLLLLIISASLTGCWSRREIEDGGFATLVAIDQAENGEIELTFNLAITGSNAGAGSADTDVPAWTVSAFGRTMAEAVASSRTFSGRLPFWFHADALIIGEDLAKSGMAPIFDFLLRRRDFRLSTPLLVAEGDAKELLKLNPKITKHPGGYLRSLLELAKEDSVSRPQSLLDALKKLVGNPGEEIYLPLIRAKPKTQDETEKGANLGADNPDQANKEKEQTEALILEGSAIFVNDKMVGKLNGAETRGMLWLRGETQRSTVAVETPMGTMVQHQIYARRTLKLSGDNEHPRAKITIYQDGDLLEHAMPHHIEQNTAAFREMDAALTAKIQADVEAALQRLQKDLRSDTLGVGARVHRLRPKLFASVDWRKIFPNLPIEVEVHANFRRTGKTIQSRLDGTSR